MKGAKKQKIDVLSLINRVHITKTKVGGRTDRVFSKKREKREGPGCRAIAGQEGGGTIHMLVRNITALPPCDIHGSQGGRGRRRVNTAPTGRWERGALGDSLHAPGKKLFEVARVLDAIAALE